MSGGQPDGELTITGAGLRLSGWTSVSVNRGIERIPATFDVRAARAPDEAALNPIPLGAPVTLAIGGHTVLVGYIERAVERLGEGQHEVSWLGRGRCCDLVDTSARIENQTRNATTIATLARALVAPYADGQIQVLTPDGEGDAKTFAGFTINLGESPYELIERIARYEGLLVYEDADGNLVLSRVGRERHASGFAQGQNIQSAEFAETTDGRFSLYIPLLMSSDTLTTRGDAPGPLGISAGMAPVADTAVTRYRPRIIVSEQTTGDGGLAAQRAAWECTRRMGRSLRITVTVDSWLDSAGRPWTPNMLAPVDLPAFGTALGQRPWLITDVQFRRDGQSGTSAVVALMPPEALAVQPSAFNALDARRLNPGPANAPLGDGQPPAKPPTAPNAGAASATGGVATTANGGPGL